MESATLISLEEYLATSYRPDREYIDGELKERNAGKWDHARVQFLLAAWFAQHERAWDVLGSTEQRTFVAGTRVRIPDVVLTARVQNPPVIVDPPVLVVEILSPDDTYTDTEERAADYLRIGVRMVWVIDPETRSGRMCDGAAWTSAECLSVPGTPIYVDLPQLFSQLNPPR